MCGGAVVPEQSVTFGLADKTIEQPVPMNVAAFSSAKKESDSAKAMNSQPEVRQLARRCLDVADRSQATGMKQGR